MKILTLLLALVLSASTARATECAPGLDCDGTRLALAPTSPMSLAPELAAQRRKAIRIRNAGIGLVVAGTVATIVGAAFMNQAEQNAFCDECNISPAESNRQDNYASTGLALIGVGQAAVLVGIPMWATGGVRAKKIDAARWQVTPAGARLTF